MAKILGSTITQSALLTVALMLSALVAVMTPKQVEAASTLDEAKKTRTIRIGYANEAPYSFATPAGVLTGEAPKVATAVLAKMGITELQGVLTEFGSLIPGLQAGRFDIIAAGMFITPKRCAQILFSEPSYGIGQQLLVKKGNPKNLKDYDSLKANKDLKLALLAGGVEVDYAKLAGLDRSQLLILPDLASQVKAVQGSRADAVASTAFAISDIASKAEGVEALQPFGTVAGKSVKGHGGFGFRKADKDLQEEFNKHLKDYIGSKQHLADVTSFGFGEAFLPNKTTADLCEDK